MFTFVFKLTPKNDIWKININGHEIRCSKSNSQVISKKINNYIISTKDDLIKRKEDSFTIKIKQLENALIYSESDYNYFNDIFNLKPLKINLSNKNFLKIFAEELEINELRNIINMFEKSYDIITKDPIILKQKELTEKILNLTKENYDQQINFLEKEIEDQIDNEFICGVIFIACQIRSNNIELLITFLKELDKRTNRGQIECFHDLIKEDHDKHQFILRALLGNDFIDLDQEDESCEFTDEELDEYRKTGYNPMKIYQAIKNDDIELFTNLMSESTDLKKFNQNINLLKYERNESLRNNTLSYIELSAFYGSEKIFNYILMNSNLNDFDFNQLTELALKGSNMAIINKCFEKVTDYSVDFLFIAIKFHQNEVFEWLIESKKIEINKRNNEESLLNHAFRYYNLDAFFCMLSNGFSYLPLFSFSLLYNNFYLAKIALKLQYNCNENSPVIGNIKMSPFLFRDNYYRLPIFYAIQKNRIDFVKVIVDSGELYRYRTHSTEKDSPIFVAAILNRFEIFKYFLEIGFFLPQKNENLFNYLIQNDKNEFTECLIQYESVKLFDQYTYSIIEFEINDPDNKKRFRIDNKYKAITMIEILKDSKSDLFQKNEYAKKLTSFFLKDGSTNTENIKKKIFDNNQGLLFPIAAKISDEKTFDHFIKKYKVELNGWDEKDIFFFVLIKSFYLMHQ